jgi:hypothetical protein
MERTEAERTIVDVERVRRRTRHALNPIWYPNIAFGLFFAGVALLTFLDVDGAALTAYWVAGGLLTIALVVRHYARVEQALGAVSPAVDASTLIVLALIVGLVVANVLTDGIASAYVPLYVGAAGAIAVGVVLRDRIEIAAGLAIAAVATAILLGSPDDPGSWANLGVGLSLLVAGLVGRERA